MATQGEKRAHPDSQNALEGIKAVLFDIEGTTTPISFLKNKLFPYVKENLKTYLENHFDNEECQADIDALRTQAEADKDVEGCVAIPAKEEDKEKVVEAVVQNVCWQMEKDATNPALKTLQGHIYREAYKTGKILGQLYSDVPEAFKGLTSSGKQIYTYSAGSVEAQKLMFGYTEQGDLTAYISGYFDTNSGAKNTAESYTKIAKEMGVGASEIAYFTDVPAEGKCAAEAGMQVTVVEREGNEPLTEEDKKTYNTVSSIRDLVQVEDVPSKKPEIENEESNGTDGNGVEGDSNVDGEEDEEELDDEEEGDEEEAPAQ